jgi:5-methylcytosine-specific restriction endonuclease McrA
MTVRLRCCSYPGCGRLVPVNSNRCEQHPNRRNRTGSYTRAAAKIRAAATECWICGQPFTDPNDPPVADHVTPRLYGGSDTVDNLRAAHRSCNGRRAQTLGVSWRPQP